MRERCRSESRGDERATAIDAARFTSASGFAKGGAGSRSRRGAAERVRSRARRLASAASAAARARDVRAANVNAGRPAIQASSRPAQNCHPRVDLRTLLARRHRGPRFGERADLLAHHARHFAPVGGGRRSARGHHARAAHGDDRGCCERELERAGERACYVVSSAVLVMDGESVSRIVRNVIDQRSDGTSGIECCQPQRIVSLQQIGGARLRDRA